MVNNELEAGGRVVALVRDLMFAARVRGPVPDAVVAQEASRVLEAVGPATRLVIVELEARGAMEVIEATAGSGTVRVVGFAPHVREDLIARARESGAEVMTRGAFVKRLPELAERATEG